MHPIIWIFLLALFITSCSTIAPPAPLPVKPISHKDRQLTLEQIKSWHIKGKMSVQAARDAGSGTMDWSQNREHYTVSLIGPLGSNGFKLIGQPGNVTLFTANGKQFSAADPEQLLAKRWGWHLPVSYLKYWIRGLAVPAISAHSDFNSYGRLNELMQQGWRVQFLSYTRTSGVDLPSKIFITSPALKIKIIIYSWRVND